LFFFVVDVGALKKGLFNFMRERERERVASFVVVVGCCCLKLIKKKLI
jgi:hypothetical protein